MSVNSPPSLSIQDPDPSLALRRERLVSSLFKYAAEIRELDEGYAFKFRRSALLIRRIAEYIVFEGQHSPHRTFCIVAELNGGALWLQVRGLKSEKHHIRTPYACLQTCTDLLV